MKTTRHVFNTPREARAFVKGVEFVNDSALAVEIDRKEPYVVITKDSDETEETSKTIVHGTG